MGSCFFSIYLREESFTANSNDLEYLKLRDLVFFIYNSDRPPNHMPSALFAKIWCIVQISLANTIKTLFKAPLVLKIFHPHQICIQICS